jgi:hypothetical protein
MFARWDVLSMATHVYDNDHEFSFRLTSSKQLIAAFRLPRLCGIEAVVI